MLPTPLSGPTALARSTLTPKHASRLTDNVTTAQTFPPPDPLSEATLRAASRLRRDTWLFLGTAFAAHAAVIVNLVAVLS